MSPAVPWEALRLLALVTGVIIGVDLVLALVWAFRRLVLKKPTFARVWSLVDVWGGAQIIALLLTLLVAAGLMLSWALVIGLRSPAAHVPGDETGFLLYFGLPATILQNVCFFGVPVAFIVFKYGKRLSDVGLPALPRMQDWWAGIVLGLLLSIASSLIGLVLETMAQQFRFVPWVREALRVEQANPVAELIRALPKRGFATLVLAVAAIGVAAPLGEEMLFRGFLFNALKRRFGLAAGLVVSGLLFAAMHTYVLGLVPIFLIGVTLAWVYHNSGSLWISIILHATNNTVGVLIAYFLPAAAK